MSGIEDWKTVQEMMRGYRVAHVLITAAQLDVFGLLAGGASTAAELADQTGAEVSGLTRLLNTAVSLNLLTKEGDSYANGSLATTCLAQEGPFYLGNLLRREGAFYQRWSYLTEAVRTGQRPDANIRDEGQRNWVLDFEMALFDIARVYAPAVAETLELPPDQPLRVLDVGGGHGGYSIALARRYANVQPTVFELPAAAAVARQIISDEAMADRVAVQEGDFQKEELGSDYDLLLLFGVLVSETPEGKVALLRKAYAALKPGGTVAVRSFWLDDTRTEPLQSTLFSLHMLLATEAGDISTQSDMLGWLREAGFERPFLKPLSQQLDSSIYLAYKPVDMIQSG